tara:strand:- start:382 stop:666 length:285 start_codon:yes stop_codon:yes gene_type:complete
MNYGTIKIPKGIIGYESVSGHGGWWYCDRESPREFPITAQAVHLDLWKNQDPFFVFKVPLCAFKPDELFNENQKFVTIWFHKEHINEIINSKNA